MSTLPIRTQWSFRSWRRGRPFWGGLIILIAGLEILTIPLAPMSIIIRAGAGAMAGYLIGGILILCGILLWFQLIQRVFLSIVAILLGLAAFPFTNLGGFILGTLLAVVGGSLAFAWTPITVVAGMPETDTPFEDDTDPYTHPGAVPFDEAPTAQFPAIGAPSPRLPHDETPASHLPAIGMPRTGSPDARTQPDGRPHNDSRTQPDTRPHNDGRMQADGRPHNDGRGWMSPHRTLGAVLLPLALPLTLALAVTGSMAASLADEVQAAPPSGATPCPEDRNATAPKPGPKPKPKPSHTGAPTPAPTMAQPKPGPSVTESPELTQPGQPETPMMDVVPADKIAAAPATPVVPGALSTPSAPTSPHQPSGHDTPAADRQPSATTSPLCHHDVPVDPHHPIVSGTHANLTASGQEMTGLSYDGIASLPTREGTIRVLQFSMDKAVSTQLEMTWPNGASNTLKQKAAKLTVSGDVKLYASRFHARLLGIPVTFTPDTPPPLVLPWMVFQDTEVKLVYMKSNQSQADGFQLRSS